MAPPLDLRARDVNSMTALPSGLWICESSRECNFEIDKRRMVDQLRGVPFAKTAASFKWQLALLS